MHRRNDVSFRNWEKAKEKNSCNKVILEKNIKKKCCSTYKEREKAQEKARGTRLRAGRVSRSPAACSGNSLEHKGRMADGEQPAVLHPNASLLPYELFQPCCLHRLLEEQQKKKRL